MIPESVEKDEEEAVQKDAEMLGEEQEVKHSAGVQEDDDAG